MTKFNHFRRGQSTFTCRVCKKLTRATNWSNGGVELCEFCEEIAGLENSLTDGIIEEAEFNRIVADLCKQHDRIDASGKPAPKKTTQSNPQHKEKTMSKKSMKSSVAAAKKQMKVDLVELRKAQGIDVSEYAMEQAAAHGDRKTVEKIAKARKDGVKAEAVKPSLADLISGKGNAVAAAVAEAASAKAPAKKERKMKIVDAEETPAAKPAAKAETKSAEKRETVASFMRRLITEGKSNEEVFAAAVKVFAIDESKKHYPSWYRSQMRRNANAEKAAAKAAAK